MYSYVNAFKTNIFHWGEGKYFFVLMTSFRHVIKHCRDRPILLQDTLKWTPCTVVDVYMNGDRCQTSATPDWIDDMSGSVPILVWQWVPWVVHT